MKLLFVEFPEHVEEALAFASECETIALTPHAGAALGVAALPFRYPEDIFHWRELEEAGIGFLSDFYDMVHRLDYLFSQELPPFAETGFTPARFAMHELLLLAGSCWNKVYRLMRVLEQTRPDQVIYFATPLPILATSVRSQHESIRFPRESLYVETLGLLCCSLGIDQVRMERPFPSPLLWAATHQEPSLPWPAPLQRLKMAAGRLPAMASRVTRPLRLGKRANRLLLIQPLVAPRLLSANAKVWRWINVEDSPVPAVEIPKSEHGLDAAVLEALASRISTDEKVRHFFRLGPHDWFPLTARRLHHFVTRMVPVGFEKFRQAEAVIRSIAPDALIYANPPKLPLQAVAYAARRSDIPVICAPHGPFGHYVNRICVMFDAIGCSHYLTGGPGANDFARRYGGEGMKLMVTGDPLMDDARGAGINRESGLRSLGLSPDRKVAILVIPNVGWNNEYAPYSVRDDRRSFVIDRRILDVLGSTLDLQIILKGHPSMSDPVTPLKAYGEAKYSDRFAYVSHWPFRLMLDMVDVIVLSYGVTTLYEALARNKRVYLINDFYPVDPPNRELLENAVYYAEDVEAFCSMLQADLESGAAFEPTGKDHGSFLRYLADPGGPKTCRQRIIKAIDEIASNRRFPNAVFAPALQA